MKPGIQGGLSLAELQQLFELQNLQTGAPNTSSLLAALGGPGLGAGSFGQQGGGIGEQPTGGQAQLAGQSASTPAGQTAGSGSGNTTDLTSLLAKFLGSAGKGIGTASPTQGGDATGLSQSDISGTSPETQAAFAAQRAGERQDFTASPTQPQSPQDPGGLQPFMNPQDPGGLQEMPAPGPTLGADTTTSTSFGQQGNVPGGNTAGGGGGLSGTNLGGAIQGGTQAGAGLLNLLAGMNTGKTTQEIAGILQTVGGTAGLLKAFPELSGLTGLSGGTLGAIGAGAGGLGGLLGLEQGVQGLMSGTNPVQSGVQLGSGALSAYSALSSLAQTAFGQSLGLDASMFPSITSMLVNSFPELASSIGLQASGQFAGEAAGQLAGQSIGGLAAGIALPNIVTLGSDITEGVRLDANERQAIQAIEDIPFGVTLAMPLEAIMSAFNPATNYAQNKLAGTMGSQVISQLEQVAGLLPPGTDLNTLSTPQLEQLTQRYGNALSGYYSAEGAGMPGGTGGDATAVMHYLKGLQETDPTAYAQSQQALQTDQTGILQSMADLQQRRIGNDVLGGLMTPSLDNIANMYRSDFVNGNPGYTTPAQMMQLGGMNSNQQLADAYGGPTWLAMQQIFGPQLGSQLGQYGGTAPGFTAPAAPAPTTPDQQIAQQYQGAPATTADIQTQYGGPSPAYLAAYQNALAQYGNPDTAAMVASNVMQGLGPTGDLLGAPSGAGAPAGEGDSGGGGTGSGTGDGGGGGGAP